jgi:hypothetical protein
MLADERALRWAGIAGLPGLVGLVGLVGFAPLLELGLVLGWLTLSPEQIRNSGLGNTTVQRSLEDAK